MAANVVILPIANIAIGNTTTDLVKRVQTIVTYLNQGPISGNTGNASFAEAANTANTANNADFLDGQHGAFYQNASNLGTGTLLNDRLSANVPYGALAGATDGWYLKHNGSSWVAAAFPTGGVAETANNADHAFGKHEGELNVNSAVSANNSTYAFGKSESALNVNSAVNANTANNSSYAYGKTESALNVNSAVNANTANNSTYAYGKSEAGLNVNSAVSANTANNATYAFGKSESALNVNSALGANNATYAYGKTEGNLNVNSAVTSNTANNATNAFGKTEGNLNVNSAVSANTANNATNAYGKTEANLNVNSALIANNATYAYSKTEGNLNVNNAVTSNTANNATNAFGKTEANLNVNNATTAGTANNSTYAFGKTEGNLNVNSALNANNATYAYGKIEGALNVNNATTAYGKTEANLNVNSAVNANTANNSAYLGGQLPAFYTNASNANTGTLPDGRLSANVVLYTNANTANKVLATPDGVSGNLVLRALTATDVDNLDDRWTEINRCGFSHPGDVETTIAFSDANATFTLANTGANWEYFAAGIEYTCTGARTVTLPNGNTAANGTYYIYINGTTGANANLVVSNSVWSMEYTSSDIPVALVLWNSSLTPKFWVGDERHTVLIDRAMHRYLHLTFGTQFVSGATINDFSLTTATNAALTFSLSQTLIMDEDKQHIIPAFADPTGETNAYSIFYRTSANNWVWAPSEVPFRYTPSGYIQWDNAGTMTEGSGAPAKYYNTYLVLTVTANTVGPNGGFMLFHGRGDYASDTAAYAEDPQQFDFSGFPMAESVITHQFTWETGIAYGTKGKVELVREKRLNIAVASASVGATVTDHNSLQSLQGGAAGQFYHLTAAQYANGITANNANNANNASYLGTKAANNYLSNVALTTLSNGDIVQWSAANSTWYNTEPAAGAPFQKLDTLVAQFNGSQTVFIMTSSGASVVPEGPEHLLVSLDGVVQEPGNAYVISGNTITFANPPYSGTTFFGVALGTVTGGGPSTPAADGMTDDGNSGSSKTINWGDGNTKHYLTLTGNCALTFANANNGGTYTLLLNSGTGAFVPTWDANCAWGPGGVPANSPAPSKTDIFSCIYVASSGKYLMSYALGY